MKIKRSKAELAGLVVLIVLSALLLPILVVNVILIVKGSVNPSVPPDVFGIAPLAVVSPSMTGEEEDSFGEGALIFVKILSEEEKESLEAGDVITFRDGETYVTHRIILAGEGFYTTQGDANNAPDPESVPLSSIVGEVVLVLPGMGSAVQFLQSPAGFFAVVGGGIVLWLISDLLSSFLQKREKGEPEED